MIVFVIGCRPGGALAAGPAASAIASLLAELPFLRGAPVREWAAPSSRFALACAAHAPGDVGGVRYVHEEARRVALFAGRPIRWLDGARADGRGPLDPRHYLAPAERWAPALDGRATAARCDDTAGELELFTDALGAYPLFRAAADGASWFSNSAEALRRLAGASDLDDAAVASVLGCGWPLDGHPIWRAVRRVPRGVVVRLTATGEATERELLPDAALAGMFRARPLDARDAAETLVASLAALADWPGRPSRVFLSGGRDSRVILAAALRAGIEVRTATGGHPEHPDQVIARALSERAGVPHEALRSDPHGDVFNDPAGAVRLIALTAAGTATAADAAGFPHGPLPATLQVVLGGQGGEIARRYYGEATSVDALWAGVMTRRPWRRELLSADGSALVREQIASWAARQRAAGVAPVDLPDAFYLLRRMGTWAGPTHGAVEWVRDTASPLWSTALLRHLLGVSVAERRAEAFHHRVTAHLAPELLGVPFEDGRVWGRPRRPGRVMRAHLKALAIRHGGPASRAARSAQRAYRRRAAAPGGLDALAADLGRRVAAQPDAPVLATVDTPRALALLGRPAATYDVIERAQVLRLATLMAAWEHAARAL